MRKTWLKSTPQLPQATNVVVTCDGKIAFYSNVEGDYQILIDVNNNNQYEVNTYVLLTGNCEPGLNIIEWDGKNNAAATVAAANITMRVRATVAEIHFPFADVEANKNGILINRLAPDMSILPDADIIFWNDNNITHSDSFANGGANANKVNMFGIKSSSNGHNWYTGSTSTTPE